MRPIPVARGDVTACVLGVMCQMCTMTVPYLARAGVYSTDAVAGCRNSKPVAVRHPLNSAVTYSLQNNYYT